MDLPGNQLIVCKTSLREPVNCSEEMSNLNLNGENRIPMALSDTAFEVHAASRNA